MSAIERLLARLSVTEKRHEERKALHEQAKANPDSKLVNPSQKLRSREYHGFTETASIFDPDPDPQEKIIGPNDLVPINFLHRGIAASRAVGLIRINVPGDEAYATGFLVSHNLLLTNNHVIPDEETAKQCFVQFDFEYDEYGFPKTPHTFAFHPEQFFITSEQLDFTLLAVKENELSAGNPGGNPNGPHLSTYSYLPLIGKTGKLEMDSVVSIIQHPGGERKKIALRNNDVKDIFNQFVHYETDTQSGSSGSPVFSDNWEVVALHSAGVPERDEQRHILNINGDRWEPNEGFDKISWIANEGIRVSSILHFLHQNASSEQMTMLEEVMKYYEPPNGGGHGGSETSYYSSSEDQVRKEDYYREIDFDQNPEELFNALNSLLRRSHSNHLSYRPSTHVYPEVDIHEDGKLRSIYSGKTFDVDELILADRKVDLEREIRILEVQRNFDELIPQEDYQRILDEIEAAIPYNCEHVVPQSWYNKRSPMRGDLHHLFACEMACNSFRSNYPFFDFTDYNPPQLEEVIRNNCGKSENRNFEPERNKGIVARATLYYLLRYPGKLEDNYRAADIDTLIRWARDLPVSIYECHRNMVIERKQGNRNPLIDYPEMIDKIAFTKGL